MRSEGRRRGAETWSFCFSHNGILIFFPACAIGGKEATNIFFFFSLSFWDMCVFCMARFDVYNSGGGRLSWFQGYKKKLGKGGTGRNKFDFSSNLFFGGGGGSVCGNFCLLMGKESIVDFQTEFSVVVGAFQCEREGGGGLQKRAKSAQVRRIYGKHDCCIIISREGIPSLSFV